MVFCIKHRQDIHSLPFPGSDDKVALNCPFTRSLFGPSLWGGWLGVWWGGDGWRIEPGSSDPTSLIPVLNESRKCPSCHQTVHKAIRMPGTGQEFTAEWVAWFPLHQRLREKSCSTSGLFITYEKYLIKQQSKSTNSIHPNHWETTSVFIIGYTSVAILKIRSTLAATSFISRDAMRTSVK